MKFAASWKTLLLLLFAATLTACGGGGGSGNDSVFNPPGINVTASAAVASIGINSATDVSVRVTQPSGQAIPDGATVTASVTPAGIGNIAAYTGGTTATTSGGNAQFRFQSGGQTGTATISFAVQDNTTPGRTITSTVNIAITATTTGDSRLVIQPQRTTLPINAFNVGPFIGSPYLTEVTITARTASGQPINTPDGIQVSVNPVGSTGGFSTLDDPETEDVNEFTERLAQGPVDVVAGRATIFVHSLNLSGPTTLTVTMLDPQTNQTVITTFTFNINAVTPPLPSNVTVSPLGAPIYVQNSGGNTSGQVEVRVDDAIGQPVPDPAVGNSAFNNVRVEIVGDAAGQRLSGINAQGQNVSGTSITVRTTNGVAGVIFTSGTRTGTTLLRATADRADNNVDNGISDAVFGDRAIVVSDGRLFSVEITQPVEGLRENQTVDPSVVVTDPDGELPISPDGTYSLTVAAIATDRLGNPVLPGTVLKFGLIDEPQEEGFGDFQIAGPDGNPQESGTLFTAPSGRFTTAGGGAGPGDALVLFGKEVEGNRDLESARVVTRINSGTSLNVDRRFNANDDTGVSVDRGNVLPYIIGRAEAGNILAQAVTNEFGVARTTMNYPVSHLGKVVVVWVQGEGDVVAGQPETVADVDLLSFAAAAPLTLVASPTAIPANTTSQVELCVSDAFASPVQGVLIRYSFNGLEGNGSVDGNGPSGALDTLTGPDGCTIAQVVTSGVLSTGSPTVVFSAGGATAEVEITTSTLVLQARPSALSSSALVTLTLLNGQGVPQPGFLIVGECTAAEGTTIILENGPGVTNAQGQTTVFIEALNLDGIGEAGSGECTFETADGAATATVTLQGIDLCETAFSPRPPGCPTTGTGTTFALNASLTGGLGSLASTPAGFSVTNCQRLVTGPATACSAPFSSGAVVSLTATPSTAGEVAVFTGECVSSGPNQATVTMSAARNCSVAFVDPTP